MRVSELADGEDTRARLTGAESSNYKKIPSGNTERDLWPMWFELPAIVRERLVSLGHAVRVLFLLDRVALALAGRDDFGGGLLCHPLLVATAREPYQPGHRPCPATISTDLHSN